MFVKINKNYKKNNYFTDPARMLHISDEHPLV